MSYPNIINRQGSARDEARRRINLLRANCRQQAIGTGRNINASCAAARNNFACALRAVVEIEDAEGVDAVAGLSDRLTAARQEAMTDGLLTAGDVIDIETQVCGL